MTQDQEVGDGTTSVTVLAAELLKEVSVFVIFGRVFVLIFYV